MTQEKTEEKWLPIVQYAQYKNISITSVRRYIKAERVKYKKVNGKYLVLARKFSGNFNNFKEKNISDLEKEIKKLKEENQELKMLISVYETKFKNINN
jgi:hypothetical protein